ncbi:MAG: baseplate J/gp47 family protein [Candidatus Thiodiazotropha sp. (ex Epidulcina cf. delphinae)]|nr:baseplate J/gp47 family protein [Candidatus Thiodiazotropha sp. (ex Epidulcina cf. delphinae)]
MSLPDIVLDDLNWQEMMEAIRSQIAAASAEEWTLHAPVDPGVTLLELLAYALEQRVYWLDQITDPLILAMLALLGEKPRTARSALTAIEIYAEESLRREVVQHTELRLSDSATEIHFRTLTDLTVLPIERVVITSPSGQRSAARNDPQRWRMRPLHLLPADRGAAEFRCDLWVRDGLGAGNTSLKLFIDLDTACAVAPEWRRDNEGPVTPPAKLRWQYDSLSGRVTLPDTAVQDGTGGLRRGGIVTLELPDDWRAGTPQHGLSPYSLWVTVERSSFSAPPLLNRLIPNVTLAAHQRERSLEDPAIHEQLEAWLPLPGIQLQLSDPLPPLEESIELSLRERDGVWHTWSPTTDLGLQGPGDRVFIVDRDSRRLTFGDGLTARIPVPDTSGALALSVSYLGGGGESGSLGTDLRWAVTGDTDLLASNPVAASGGRETESATEARQRAASDLMQCERAVTAADFETLALSTGGIALARAHAAVGYHPDFPCHYVAGAVTLFIVPEVPRNDTADAGQWVPYPQPDPGAVEEVLYRLDERRLVTTEVFVRGPVYRPVSVRAVLSGSQVSEQSIERALARYFDPLIGGEKGTGWPFGHAVRPSEIAHVIDTLTHGQAVVTALTITLDDEGVSSDCEDLAIGEHELVCLQQLSLESRARQAERGGLR